jgi:hypothetical protein
MTGKIQSNRVLVLLHNSEDILSLSQRGQIETAQPSVS